ncbi:type II toxin-antitoxin system HicA family toxin [Tindallia californiensis]|uniref:Predicted RNA binding protein YcfA, dsRBD-like fold, HicA-like mRNA interferase family n=1 Tax=Tindallia californiensis TaxID=159292 RepID=A0A1H3R9N8_9FIRM|nr:type II toxin-antitoxin system HicA family toxin [Tindallia californiensis]SDZ22484.1 Predicted RNA binding protein YcfA, dsRBD-like fold, HicA-like mRNA interferase family [Tindallia californiensis]
MGSKYPILSPNKIIKALEKIDFRKVSRKGSHAKYKKLGIPTRVVIIPMHDKVAKGTLKSNLEQADIPLDKFLNLL